MKLKPLLEAQGVKVIMIRTSENVTISNKERAEIANAAEADLFLRLHCDGIDSSSANGISMQAPANSGWPAASYSRSEQGEPAHPRQSHRATGAKDRGIVERGDLAGFNWCKVPSGARPRWASCRTAPRTEARERRLPVEAGRARSPTARWTTSRSSR